MGLIIKLYSFVFTIYVVMACSNAVDNTSTFDENYQVLYGESHITKFQKGKRIQLLIDPSSGGAGFRSKLEYLSGSFKIRMKLPPQSAGIITSFYLITGKEGSGHDELDFEFLGDKILQTNVYVKGVGEREQRFGFWFDPTLDFHTYQILWNPFSIAFFVDDTPIRVFKNEKKHEIPYLENPMHIEATLWSADWAGGPVNWTNGPFKAQYEDFGIDGCPSRSGSKLCGLPGLKWNKFRGMKGDQIKAYRHIKEEFLTYDYCSDPKRQPANPIECEEV